MRRIIFFAAALMLTLSVTAQNKMLSSKQLMTRGLYPQATMRGFQFVGNTDQIAYVQDTVLYMGNPGKTKARLTLGALNKVLVASGEESLSYFPYCKILNDKELRFNAAGKMLLYNMAKKTLSVIAKYPTQDAQHLDMEENYYRTAYTFGNNLYVKDGGVVYPIESPDQDIVFGQSASPW